MLPVPFAGVEVLDPVRFEQDGVVDEPGLFVASVVPEGVRVPERDVRRVLERASAVGARCESQEPAAGDNGRWDLQRDMTPGSLLY